MSSENDERLKKLSIMSKLLYMQIRPLIEERKRKLKLTEKQMQIYVACDGTRAIEEIAETAKCSVRHVERLLPKWERMGLILSTGKGTLKKYTNIESFEV